MKVYTDGEFISSRTFSYPYFHEDLWTKYNTVIASPTVVVAINAGNPGFRFNLFGNLPGIIRSASHILEDK